MRIYVYYLYEVDRLLNRVSVTYISKAESPARCDSKKTKGLGLERKIIRGRKNFEHSWGKEEFS